MWSPSVPVMLHKSWWLPMAVCLQYLHLHSLRTWKWHLKIVCVHLGATGQAWVPLSFLSMLFSSISHCPGMDQVGWASWSVSPGYTSVSTSPRLGLQACAIIWLFNVSSGDPAPKGNLELLILPLLPPEWWDQKLRRGVYATGDGTRMAYTVGKHSTDWTASWQLLSFPLFSFFLKRKFEAGSLDVQASLKISKWPRVTLGSWISCLHLPNVG